MPVSKIVSLSSFCNCISFCESVCRINGDNIRFSTLSIIIRNVKPMLVLVSRYHEVTREYIYLKKFLSISPFPTSKPFISTVSVHLFCFFMGTYATKLIPRSLGSIKGNLYENIIFIWICSKSGSVGPVNRKINLVSPNASYFILDPVRLQQ